MTLNHTARCLTRLLLLGSLSVAIEPAVAKEPVSFPDSSQSLYSYAVENRSLIRHYDFSTESQLQDWVMEGPGVSQVSEGKLLLKSRYFDEIQTMKARGDDMGNKSLQKRLGTYVEKHEPDFYPNQLSKNGSFRGGNFVLWNKYPTPDHYMIEFDFQSLVEDELHMIMLSNLTKDGRSVFSDDLPERHGLASSYTMGEIVGYRFSFMTENRGTTNLRIRAGQILAQGPDVIGSDFEKQYRVSVIKKGERIQFLVNGQLIVDYRDETPLEGGYFAIRLMPKAKAYYSNFSVYQLN